MSDFPGRGFCGNKLTGYQEVKPIKQPERWKSNYTGCWYRTNAWGHVVHDCGPECKRRDSDT